MEEHTEEREVIGRIIECHKKGMRQKDIVAKLRDDDVPAPRGERWNRTMIFRILKRAGVTPERIREYRQRGRRQKVQRDKQKSETRAKELRAQGPSLRAIGERLLKEKLYPPRGEPWYAATVAELLSVKGAEEAAKRERELRAEGHSLREVGRLLLYEGYPALCRGRWEPSTLAQMTRDIRRDDTLS